MSASQPRRPPVRGGARLAPVVSALVTLALHVVVLVRQHTFPFGPVSRGLGDYGAQYLPFHQALAQALHGSDLVSARFSWLAGMGVATIPDYATYVASPLNLVLAVVPLDHVELALGWIVLAKVALAAATMTLLLRALAPRVGPVPAVLLGVAYGCSTWVFDIAIYTPQWLDGLVGFPLLCLVALWCHERRHLVPGVLAVGVVWWANYYTAYMASIGAAIFLLLWLGAVARTAREAMLAVVRFAVTGLLGVALTAPILLPTVLAVGRGTPYSGGGMRPLPVPTALARLLPFTEGVASTPSLAAGSLVLVLVGCLPLAARVPLRQRIVLTVGLALILLSVLFRPAVIVWNAFDEPNGNPYRFTFVLTGLLIVGAYTALLDGGLRAARRHTWPPLLATALVLVVTAALAVIVHRLPAARLTLDARSWQWPLGVAALGVVAAVLRGRARLALVALLVVGGTAEVVLNANLVDRGLRKALMAAPLADASAPEQQAQAAAALRTAGWPVGRVGPGGWPGRQQYLSFNTGMGPGYPTVNYYSSTLPGALSRALTGLGAGIRAGGRMVVDPPGDPVLDALLAVRVRSSDPGLATASIRPALPLVREIGPARPSPSGLTTPFRERNTLLHEDVYTAARWSTADSRPLVRTLAPGASLRMTVSCPAPTRVQVATYQGNVTVAWSSTEGRHAEVPGPFAGVVGLPAGSDGQIEVRNSGTGPVEMIGVACLDEQGLRDQLATTVAPTIEVRPGTVTATFARPVAGTAVVATVAQQGWSCSVDGRPAAVTPRSGLLAVDMAGGRTLACGYRTPGVTAGLAVGGAALLVTLAWGLLTRRRRRA